MLTEAVNENRRQELIKMSALGLAVTAGGIAAASKIIEAVSQLSNESAQADSEHTPYLKEVLRPSSMIAGIAPHNNDFKNLAYRKEYGIVNLFASWHKWALDRDVYTAVISQTPMISVLPFDATHPNGFTYKELAQQKHHIFWQAQKLSSFKTFYLRYGYEMNGPWYRDGSGKHSAREYVDGWKLIAEIVKKVAPQAQLVWCPNVGYPFEKFYPGDQYVDVVALDGYNKYHPDLFHARHFHPNPSFSELFGPDIRKLQDMYRKPIHIAEIGIEQGAASLPWLVDAFNQAPLYDRLTAISIFAWNKKRGNLDYEEADWRKMLTPELHDAIRVNPYYRTSDAI